MARLICNKVWGRRRVRGGFTLVEVAASVVILSLLLAGVLVAFQRTRDGLAVRMLRGRAAQVAERQMERLIGSGQEPNSVDLQGRDEIDPAFMWEIALKRESVDKTAAKQDLSNTVIKATVTVRSELFAGGGEQEQIELVRYFATLKPIPGQAVAVPLTPDFEEALWYLELYEKLGREPSIKEIFEELARRGELPEDFAEEFDIDANEAEIDFEDLEGFDGAEEDETDDVLKELGE